MSIFVYLTFFLVPRDLFLFTWLFVLVLFDYPIILRTYFLCTSPLSKWYHLIAPGARRCVLGADAIPVPHPQIVGIAMRLDVAPLPEPRIVATVLLPPRSPRVRDAIVAALAPSRWGGGRRSIVRIRRGSVRGRAKRAHHAMDRIRNVIPPPQEFGPPQFLAVEHGLGVLDANAKEWSSCGRSWDRMRDETSGGSDSSDGVEVVHKKSKM
jgi:hypothetical protein